MVVVKEISVTTPEAIQKKKTFEGACLLYHKELRKMKLKSTRGATVKLAKITPHFLPESCRILYGRRMTHT